MNELESFLKGTYISKDYASIDVKDFGDISKFIELFDLGHKSIMILENGKFKGFVEQYSFRDQMANHKIPIISNIWLEYDEDEEKNKLNSMPMLSNSILQDIPLLKNGEIVSVVTHLNTIGASHHLNEVEFPPIYWDLINDDLADNLLSNKKILISSLKGNLFGFKKRFEHIANIEVFSTENWVKYLNGYLLCKYKWNNKRYIESKKAIRINGHNADNYVKAQ